MNKREKAKRKKYKKREEKVWKIFNELKDGFKKNWKSSIEESEKVVIKAHKFYQQEMNKITKAMCKKHKMKPADFGEHLEGSEEGDKICQEWEKKMLKVMDKTQKKFDVEVEHEEITVKVIKRDYHYDVYYDGETDIEFHNHSQILEAIRLTLKKYGKR